MKDGFVDPHNGGTYSVTGETADALTGQRTTGDGKYTDKFDFTFTGNGEGCEVEACSESQVTSVIDYSTNYCNLHVLYDGLKNSETFSSCSQHDDVCVVAAEKGSLLSFVNNAIHSGEKALGL